MFSDGPGKPKGRGLPTSNRRSMWADGPGEEFVVPQVNERTARQPVQKAESEPGFWEGVGRANLGLLQSSAGRLIERLPETLSEGLASTADIVGSGFGGLPRGLPGAIVRSQTERVVTPENTAAYRQAVRPASQSLMEAGQRQQQLAGPGKFKSPTQQDGFSLSETAGFMGEQALRNIAPAALGLTVGALTRSPGAARAVMGGTGYGATLDEVMRSQEEQGFQDVNRAVNASLAATALDVLTGGEAKVAQAVTKDVKQALFREGVKDFGKDLLKLGGAEAGTEALQTGFERYGAKKDLFSREALNEYIDSAAAGFGGGVVMGGGVRLLTGNRKPQTNTENTGADLLNREPGVETEAATEQKPFVAPSFLEKDADDNDVVNMETIRANPKMALDELGELYSRDNIIASLAGDTEADDYVSSLGARVHRAVKSQNPKSIPNLVRSLKRDIDPDIHGEDVAAQRSPLVSKAALMLGDYVGLRNEAMAADERATNPALVTEQVAAKNADELARVQALRQQEQDEATAEQARAEAERQAALDAAAKEVERIHRAGIMDAVSKDPKTRNPVARFQALLKRNGFDPELTADEQVALTKASVNAEQRLAAEAAQMDMTVAEYKQMLAEDEARQRQAESGTASMEALIPEAGTKQPTPAKPKVPEMVPGKTNRAAPENFQLEAQRELTDADIAAQQKAAARRQAKADRELAKSNARAERRAARAQGQLFTPTGRPAKAAVQAPKVTVAEQIKEKVSAAKEGQKPKGRVAERVGADEKRKATEASRRNRPEPSTEKRQEVAETKEKVTHEQVAERANEARQNGYINEATRGRIALLAEQKNVPAETLNDMLDQAVERGSTEKMAVKPGQKAARATRAERGQLADALKKELQRLGLNKVGLGVVNDLVNIFENGIAAGRYMPGWGMIDVVYADTKQAMETLHHEVIHYLRDANIITDAEWETLSAAARADKKLMERVDRDWPTLNNEEKTEEAIAEMFREWMTTQRTQPGIRGVFQKLKNFITALRRGFNKPEFAAVKQVFTEINEGKRGDQNVTTLRGDPSGAVKLSIEERLDKANVPSQVGRQTGFVAEKFNDFYNKFSRFGMMHTVIEGASKAGLKHAEVYQDARLDQMRVRRSLEEKASKVLEKVKALPTEYQRLDSPLNKLLQDSTMQGKWAFKPTWLKEGTYEIDPELQKQYEALPKEGKDFVRGVFEVNHEMRQAIMKAADDSIDTPYDVLIKEALDKGETDVAANLRKEREGARAKITSLFNVNPSLPYASLSRNGDYAVSAKSAEYLDALARKDQKAIRELESNPEHNFFNKYETEAQAKAEVKRLRETGVFKDVYTVEDDGSLNEIFGGRETYKAFQTIFSAISKNDTLGDKNKRALQSMITDLQLSSLSNASARKAQIKRRMIYGGQLDMIGNFARQSMSMAHHISSLKNNDVIVEAFNGMRREVKEAPDTMEASKFLNEIARRHMYQLQSRPNKLIESLKRLTAVYKIAFSPSFYIQNMLQVPMMVGPELAARFGLSNTRKYLAEGMQEVAKAWKDTRPTESLNLEQLSPDVRDVVQRLADMSLIDVGLDADLGDMKSTQARAGQRFGAVGEAFDKSTEVLAAGTNVAQDLTRKQEAINRTAAAVAAFRAELKRTGNRQKAQDYAVDLIRNTMFTYDAFNAPTYMQGVGGIPFQFRKFQLGQVTLLLRHIRNGYTDPALSPEEAAIARKALKYQIGTSAMMAGIRGLPGASALLWLYSMVSGDDDEAPEDLETVIRNVVGDEDIADFLIYGAPSLVDVNMSNMVGFGSTFSILPFTDLEATKEGVAKAAFALGGAGPATVTDIALSMKKLYDDLGEGREDYYRNLEKMLPKGFSNIIASYRESAGGVTSPKGKQLVDAEDVTYLDTMKTLLGIQSVKSAERFRKQDVERGVDQFFKDKSAKLKRQYVTALDNGDSKKMQDLRNEWIKMNDARAKAGMKRQPITTLLRAKAERMREEELTVGGVQYRSKDARYQRALAEEAEEK